MKIAPRIRRSIFWVFLTSTHLFYQHDIFEWSQILSRYIFETGQRCHRINIFFEICLRRLKYVVEMYLRRLRQVTKKTFFLRRIWDVLKTSQKRRFFWDVSERFLRCLSQWRSDWDISETSHAGWEGFLFNFLIQLDKFDFMHIYHVNP